MDDLISGQAMIDAIFKSSVGKQLLNYHKDLIAILKNLQSAQQKNGKWIKGKCSECGEHAPYWSMSSTYYESKFCPNCGKRMEEVTE